MGTVEKPYNFTTGVISSSEVNADFDTLYTLVNGNIEAANIKANTITDDEMATSASPVTRHLECLQDFVYTGMGCVDSGGGTATVAAGTAYVKGVRVVTTVSSAKHTVDGEVWYCDVDTTGSYIWTASVVVTTDALRLCKVTNASDVLTIVDLRPYSSVGYDLQATISTTTTGAVATSATTFTTLDELPMNVKTGDILNIHAGTQVLASGTVEITFGFLIDDVAMDLQPIASVGTAKDIITFDYVYEVEADEAQLPIESVMKVANTATTATASNRILSITRYRPIV